MAAATVTSYAGLVRSIWPQKKIYEVLVENSPVIGMMPKDTTFDEKVRYIGVGYGAPQGVGPDFGIAKSAKTSSVSKEFGITAVTYYALFSLDGRLTRMAKSNRSVIVKPLAKESKNSIYQLKMDLSSYIFGNGGGAIAQGAIVSGQTITLADTQKIRFIKPGMRLSSSATDGTSGSVNPGYVTVSTVNRDAGSFVVAEASVVAGIPAYLLGDYLFRYGVFGNVVSGLAAWIPSSAPGATSYFGVDRTADTLALGGVRTTATGLSPREALQTSAKDVHDAGGDPDWAITSSADWLNLELECQSAGSLIMTQAPAAPISGFNFGVKYDGIKLMGPSGPIIVTADPNCTTGRGYMLTKDTWTLASTGELVQMIQTGGPDDLMVEESADAFEGRWVSDHQLYTEAPGFNGTFAL